MSTAASRSSWPLRVSLLAAGESSVTPSPVSGGPISSPRVFLKPGASDTTRGTQSRHARSRATLHLTPQPDYGISGHLAQKPAEVSQAL